MRFSCSRLRWVAAAATLTHCALGCSLTVDSERAQCSTNQDCAARGPSFAQSVCVNSWCEVRSQALSRAPDASDPSDGAASAWDCLKKPPAPSPQPPPYHITMHLTDPLSASPLSGVSGRLCNKLDLNCDQPQSEPAVSDDDGVLTFDVTNTFNGYVSLSRSDILPGLYFFNPQVDRDRDIPSAPLVTPAQASGLTAVFGGQQQPDLGLILLTTYDCSGRAATGVSFASENGDTSTVLFYIVGGLPNAKETATDGTGYGGFTNMPPGTVVVRGTLAATGSEIGTISLLSKAGAITYSRIVPPGM